MWRSAWEVTCSSKPRKAPKAAASYYDIDLMIRKRTVLSLCLTGLMHSVSTSHSGHMLAPLSSNTRSMSGSSTAGSSRCSHKPVRHIARLPEVATALTKPSPRLLPFYVRTIVVLSSLVIFTPAWHLITPILRFHFSKMITFPLKDNPRAAARIGVETFFIALDFVFVGLRLWARRIKRKSLGFNDYTIVAALVSRTCHGSSTIITNHQEVIHDCQLHGYDTRYAWPFFASPMSDLYASRLHFRREWPS